MKNKIRVAGRTLPVWFLILIVVFAGSMVASNIQSGTVKEGQIAVVVGQRLSVQSVGNIQGDEPARSTAAIDFTPNSDSFVARFIADPGESFSFDVTIANFDHSGAVAYVVIDVGGNYSGKRGDAVQVSVIGDFARQVANNKFAIFVPPATDLGAGFGTITVKIKVLNGVSGGTFFFNVKILPV